MPPGGEVAGPPSLIADARMLGVSLDPPQAEQLGEFAVLIQRWNRSYNLVSRKDIDRLWTRHILDSLSITPLINQGVVDQLNSARAGRIVDVGTGGGFPGLPLAIARPDLSFTLIDRSTRKIRFVELVAKSLGLSNLDAYCMDVRELVHADPERFDSVVSRAVAAPAELWESARGVLKPGGHMVLMTGVSAVGTSSGQEKTPSMPTGARLLELHRFVIPGLDQFHQVMIMAADEHGVL